MAKNVSHGPDRAYGKDYWDLVLDQLRRRRSVRLAAWMLVVIYAVAIYAPFIANERPLLLQGVDYGSYRKARSLLPPIAMSLRRMAREGRTTFEAEQSKRQGGQASQDMPTWDEAVQQEQHAIADRLATMRRYLASEDAGPLLTLEARLSRVVEALRAERSEEALEAAGALVDQAKRVRSEMVAARPDSDGTGLALHPVTSYPVLEDTGKGEIYFMGLWLLVLTFPLWSRVWNRWVLHGDRNRVRAARRFKVAAVLGLPLLPLLFWTGTTSSFYVSGFKEALDAGDIVASRVVFPPLRFGLAEQNTSEFFRPPTWHDESLIDEQGFYVHGARAPRDDLAEGTRPVAQPVIVRASEPAANAPGRHILGTDSLGRDLLARSVWGARISLSVGFVAATLIVAIGTILGALAGYFGGWVDIFISRAIEVFQCFPVLFFALIVVAFLGPGILNIMLVLGLLRWTGTARLARGEFIRLRHQDFVVASEALGVPTRRTIFRHVLPNAMGPILVSFTFSVAAGILIESTLSYLGFGIQLPVPSWGSLLIESSSAEHWWIQVFPGLAIFITVLLYNLLGEGVRDALDPRIRKT